MNTALRLTFSLFACLFLSTSAAQEVARKPVTYNEIQQGLFSARTVSGLRSTADGEYFTTLEGGVIRRFRYSDGALVDTLCDGREWGVEGYEFSADGSKILLVTRREKIYRHSSRANYLVYDCLTRACFPLSERGKQQEATFSPDGRRAAFVRGNNLFWVDLAARVEQQLTFDGQQGVCLNGIPDWVYEEEYAYSRAYEWSPASDAIAFCRFSESRVPNNTIILYRGALHPTRYDYKYPKAGDDNSLVDVWVVNLDGNARTRVNLPGEEDRYVPRIGWSPDGRVVVHHLNRLQNHYQVLLADPKTGSCQKMYDERKATYVERIDDRTITFLPDGKGFIVKAELDGFMHLHHYDLQGNRKRQITRGEWEVVDFYGLDAKNRLYYLSTEGSPLRRSLWVVDIDGKHKRRLTPEEGTHAVAFSKGMRYYIDHFSTSASPTVATLYRADGTPLRVLQDNRAVSSRVREYALPIKEFFRFVTSNGDTLNGYLLKPVDFDPSKRYPVLMTQYSGPGSQQVADRWSVSWEWTLPARGVLVACVDGRGTGFRGEAFRKCTYGNLGDLERIDQMEAARHLGALPYVDAARIGIYGWSFGGFMTLNCLVKGDGLFALGIAVAPVTSWRFYDTIYTELYNGLPQQNPGGYDQNSPLNFASSLQGKLLIAHGTADDNVHIQNSYEMISALAAAGKPFEMAIYPDRDHGMGNDRHHLLRRCIEFVVGNL